jgi:hypothetical protein
MNRNFSSRAMVVKVGLQVHKEVLLAAIEEMAMADKHSPDYDRRLVESARKKLLKSYKMLRRTTRQIPIDPPTTLKPVALKNKPQN